MRLLRTAALGVALLLGAAPLTGVAAAAAPPPARAIDDSCPTSAFVDGLRFMDVVSGSTHQRAIDCMGWWGIAKGRTPTEYDPSGTVTRDAMAAFVARVVLAAGGVLPAAPPSTFFDVAGNPHQLAVHQLAAVGVVAGTGGGAYSPRRPVTRAQMATFLSGAARHVLGAALPAGEDWFADAGASPHRAAIGQVARAGLTGGLPGGTYGPDAPVTREQMATFLARLLDLLVENGHGTLPPVESAGPTSPPPLAVPSPLPGAIGPYTAPSSVVSVLLGPADGSGSPICTRRPDGSYDVHYRVVTSGGLNWAPMPPGPDSTFSRWEDTAVFRLAIGPGTWSPPPLVVRDQSYSAASEVVLPLHAFGVVVDTTTQCS